MMLSHDIPVGLPVPCPSHTDTNVAVLQQIRKLAPELAKQDKSTSAYHVP